MQELNLKILENKPIASNIYKMRLALPYKIEGLKAGKFINISVNRADCILKRPLGIASYTDKFIDVCYQIKGIGTSSLKTLKENDIVAVTLPLGNGFEIGKEHKKIALIGGGVGVFPLYCVSDEYKDREIYSFIGTRCDDQLCLLQEFNNNSKNVLIATQDGSYGKCGNAVELFLEHYKSIMPDIILCCGPTPMLKAIKSAFITENIKIKTLVSLEERMACGIGACLVCACRKTDKDNNVRVCKDGPVFDIWEVEL